MRKINAKGGNPMYFVLLGYDGTDSEAMGRRMAARPAHLEAAKALKEAGVLKYGGPLLNEEGNMKGSILVLQFDSEEALRTEYLATEPYITGDVWRTVEIHPHKPSDFFL